MARKEVQEEVEVSETAETVVEERLPLTRDELYKAIDAVLATATSDSVFHKRAYASIVRLIEVSELTPQEEVSDAQRNSDR